MNELEWEFYRGLVELTEDEREKLKDILVVNRDWANLLRIQEFEILLEDCA